jgi:MFS family permease
LALPLLILSALCIIGYGWMMDHKISLAGPIIMLFIVGYAVIGASQILNILLVDIYPGQPATAASANNVTRCLIGAAATAAIGPMSEAIGNGWSYTILAVLTLVACLGPLATMKYGVVWRTAKKEKLQRNAANEETKRAPL